MTIIHDFHVQSTLPINDDAPGSLPPAAIAFPILHRHWPRFDEEFAASVFKNALPLQHDPAPCAKTMIENQGVIS